MKKTKNGNTVSVHYVGTLDDGTEFDSSRKRNEPLVCEVGAGKLISGFDDALVGMSIGETKSISLSPSQAYGEIINEAFQTVPKDNFPPGFEFSVGRVVQGNRKDGLGVARARIDTVDDNSVKLNFNHPMAGKNLNFEIELIDIKQD